LEINTIGLASRSASDFFGVLNAAGVRRVLDTRLHNTSQLAGFSKKTDLEFFLKALTHAEYRHEVILAPTDELLRAYRRRAIAWGEYSARYLDLLKERGVENVLSYESFSTTTALLCAEQRPDRCHRRLAAEYLAAAWPGVTIRHL
jgi:uncharacterized protein (DUF488 family)